MRTPARSSFAALLLGSLAFAPMGLAEGHTSSLCANHPVEMSVYEAWHRDVQRRTRMKVSAPNVTRSGQVALIEDDGTLLAPPNAFDLSGRSMQFLRRPKGTSVVRSNLGLKEPFGERLELDRNEAVEVVFPDDFRFPFGEATYDRVFVNANGSLTFGAPDPGTGDANLTRFFGGPPRLAPGFAELDPAASPEGGGVYLRFLPGRVRVTWYRVPYVRTLSENTFQVTLFTTGRAVFAYGDVDPSQPLVVGASPGNGPDLHLLDYNLELPFRPPRKGAVAELFTTFSLVDDFAVARAFFDHFADDYDHLVVWLGFPQESGEVPNFRPYHLNAKNDVAGIGLETFDLTSLFGSEGRLESYVQMRNVDLHPADPDAINHLTLTAVGWLAQEVAHRWLAHVRFRDGAGMPSRELVDPASFWSFAHHTGGSLLGGNDIVDNLDGTFLTTANATQRFSRLDQYLLGFLPPEAVPDFFYVDDTSVPPTANPEPGVTFSGRRVDVRVDDVIAAEGPRLPTSAEAPKQLRTAFVVLTRQGQTADAATIAKIDRYRRRWVEHFSEATDGNGQAATALRSRRPSSGVLDLSHEPSTPNVPGPISR